MMKRYRYFVIKKKKGLNYFFTQKEAEYEIAKMV